MTSKLTPGPWFVQPGFLNIYNLAGGTTGLTCAIAKVLSDQPGMDAAKANASLIAAAPDLLAALRSADQWIKLLCDEMDIEPRDTEVTVSANGPDGRRELAKLNLAESQLNFATVIARAEGISA
jgi:hypothetical protein